MPEETKKRFEEKFGGSMKWIKLNCKNEIIDGVSIDNIELDLLSFIESECQRREEKAKQEARWWKMALVHLPKEWRESVIKTHEALMAGLDDLTHQSITKI